MGAECSTHKEKKNACRVFEGKPERKRIKGKIRHRWEGNIKMNFKEIIREGAN
jgi:hypothetical protein